MDLVPCQQNGSCLTSRENPNPLPSDELLELEVAVQSHLSGRESHVRVGRSASAGLYQRVGLSIAVQATQTPTLDKATVRYDKPETS